MDRTESEDIREETGSAARSRVAGAAVASELESIRERALEVLANYRKTKAVIRKEVRKEYATEIRHLENERSQREMVIKEKMAEIDRLRDTIESLNNEVFGLRSKSKLWEHECARISDTYHRTVLYYSNPGLVEVQLQVISEYVDALARFVSVHKWDRDTADMAERYRDSIHAKLHEVIRGIDMNPKEDTSLASARNNVGTVPADNDTKI
ncbi:MAG: hypothetical protein A4E61_00917 [Syntrophorhabdus sp. PtaB.Bin184]|jgi:phage gp36-like protein|nr:MAG: hypothetical protein A4E61_00917 [Syntrophorhabdus sp. PtaB.Bin184]